MRRALFILLTLMTSLAANASDSCQSYFERASKQLLASASESSQTSATNGPSLLDPVKVITQLIQLRVDAEAAILTGSADLGTLYDELIQSATREAKKIGINLDGYSIEALRKALDHAQANAAKATDQATAQRVKALKVERTRVATEAPWRNTQSFEGVETAALSPDGESIVIKYKRGFVTKVLDVRTKAEITSLKSEPGFAHTFSNLEFSPTGDQVLTVTVNFIAEIWNAHSGERVASLEDEGVLSASYNSDGSRIVTRSMDNVARVWNAETGELLFELDGKNTSFALESVMFSPDGKSVITASENGIAEVWNAETGKFRYSIDNNVHNKNPRQKLGLIFAAFSPGNDLILTTSATGNAKLWNAISGKFVREYPGHDGKMLPASFSQDGLQILTYSTQSPVRISRVIDGSLVGVMKTPEGLAWGDLTSAQFMPDAFSYVITAQGGNPLVIDLEGNHRQSIPIQQRPVRQIVVSRSGSRVLTISENDRALIMDRNLP